MFWADLRLEFGGKNNSGWACLWHHKKWDTKPPELYFNWTKVLMGIGTIGLIEFKSVYDQRPTEMCITANQSVHTAKVWVKKLRLPIRHQNWVSGISALIIIIIIIIITDIYEAPFLSRAHSAYRYIQHLQYTMHKQPSHLMTCNLLTKHTHTLSINTMSLCWKKVGLGCWSKERNWLRKSDVFMCDWWHASPVFFAWSRSCRFMCDFRL